MTPGQHASFLGKAFNPLFFTQDPNAANFPVPELVGCTLSNGVGAGFPRGDSTATSEEFCRDLGLTIWAG